MTGQVIIITVQLDWESDSEPSGILGYKISRWNGSGWTAQAFYYAAQTCSRTTYQHVDTNNSSGTYQVSALAANQSVICTYQVTVH